MADYIPETLRDIDDEILRITFQGLSRQENDALINASEGDLTTPVEITDDEIFKQLDELEMKRDKKVENIGYALLKQDAKIEELGTEIKRLQRWQKRIKGRRKGLTWYLRDRDDADRSPKGYRQVYRNRAPQKPKAFCGICHRCTWQT